MPEISLDDLAVAIADGTPIDWDRLGTASGPAAPFIERARLIERIADVHAELPSASSFSESLRPLRTDDAGEIAPAAWGPLTNLEKIGRGTFGDVYRALDPRLNRHVALKLLKQRDRRESEVIEEGHLLARVQHPNVVTVYGAERIDGRVGLWMELINGRTLAQELAARGPLPSDEVAHIGADLSRALAAVHHAGLLHRDVKAQNVMRDVDGRVLLTDFGAGRELPEPDTPAAGRELAGTPLYLAPEVLAGQPASRASDIYSLGVLLFHVLTGSFPVRARSVRDLREAHERRVRADLRAIRPDVPSRLAAAIERALDPDPTRRYATAEAFGSALAPERRRSSLRPAWMIAAALSIVLAGIGVWKWRDASVAERLDFRPRDFVLITRFDNRTGEHTFGGAVEYALERALSNSNVVGLVPGERVDDALQMMKRPLDTVVDRAIGREVAQRDGNIKVMVAGRIEKLGPRYVLTTQLVDPADDSVVATIGEEAADSDRVAAAVTRTADRVRLVLGERRERITGISQKNEAVSTRSLRAFQLYQQSVQLKRLARAAAAQELARQCVTEDPGFASGWIQLAWTTVNRAGVVAGALGRPQYRAVREEIRPYIERAHALAETTADWERNWILGSYYSLSLEPARAVPFYEALLLLRPDHPWAAADLDGALRELGQWDARLRVAQLLANQRPNSFQLNRDAARFTVQHTRSVKDAAQYIERMRRLLPEQEEGTRTTNAQTWLDFLPVYAAWDSRNVEETLALVSERIRQLPARSAALQRAYEWAIGDFLMTLGRLGEGREHHLRTQPDAMNRAWSAAIIAYLQGDSATVRKLLPSIDFSRYGPRTLLLMETGFVDRARAVVRTAPLRGPGDDALKTLARGDLLLFDRQPRAALPLLEQAVADLRPLIRFEYYTGCESLATALRRVNRTGDAIHVLEECAAERPRYQGTNFFHAPHWLRLMLRLAGEYRDAGRTREAEGVEREVRHLLTYADADHPVLVSLSGR